MNYSTKERLVDMRVLFIVPYPSHGPSNRFRVEQYLPLLTRKNIGYRVRPFCNKEFYFLLRKKGYYLKKFLYLVVFSFRRLMDLACSPFYDVIFIHREAFPTKDYIFEWLFRRFAKKLIYDFDDAVFLKKPAKARAVIRMADSVISGNRFLKEYASSLNGEVYILPTPIDTDKYAPVTKAGRGGNEKIVIGWMGTPTTSEYLKDIKNVFRAILNRYKNVEIDIVGGMSVDFLGAGLTHKAWSLENEVRDLQGFDIGIMPMPDNEWTKGKCAFKIIQYMAVGIPAVASPVGMNREVVQDSVNGFFASNNKEWIDKLSSLIEDASLRDSIGGRGRLSVESRYSVRALGPKFIEILERTASKKAG